MPEGVSARALLAALRLRSGALLSVAPVGGDLSFARHRLRRRLFCAVFQARKRARFGIDDAIRTRAYSIREALPIFRNPAKRLVSARFEPRQHLLEPIEACGRSPNRRGLNCRFVLVRSTQDARDLCFGAL